VQNDRVEKRDEFLRALQTETFDLILADYSLPSFDGISALQLAHSVCPDSLLFPLRRAWRRVGN
jgi:CheY-like chemotaxis protein